MDTRTEKLTSHDHKKNVLYIMKRDFRIFNNHSIDLCYELSEETETQFYILTNLQAFNPNLNTRQKAFIEQGIDEMETDCIQYNIHFIKDMQYSNAIKSNNIDCIVTEASPLRQDKEFIDQLCDFCSDNSVALYVCDSHNIVPAANLEDYCKSAPALKKRLYSYLPKYLTRFADLQKHKFNVLKNKPKVLQKKNKNLKNMNTKNKTAQENRNTNKTFIGGHSAGLRAVKEFFTERMPNFKAQRNNASLDCLSYLDPYILTGQLGSQEVALLARSSFSEDDENLVDFMNEIFVWKETAEHFAYSVDDYDNFNGVSEWAAESLKLAEKDKRPEIYKYEDFVNMKTKNTEFNAAMNELKTTGHVHLYAFLFWCKALVSMTEKPEDALSCAFKLIDRYSITGGFPYTNLWIMYAVCGVYDRGFGVSRYMGKVRSIKSIKSNQYVAKWDPNR